MTRKRVKLDEGKLTPEIISLMINHLPLELTLLDEDDRVVFYSDVSEKIFPRKPEIIGRDVRKCHPPQSLLLLERILEKFRSGVRDMAEFWVQKKGAFIHIRYLALRDSEGKYKGCLEVVQDVTKIRKLKGQRLLLNW